MRFMVNEPRFAVRIWQGVRETTLGVQGCAGWCAHFEIAESLDTTGFKQGVQGVQGNFKLKFNLKKKDVFLKNR